MDLDAKNPFSLFLILILLTLSMPDSGTYVDRHLDRFINSLQAARDSIQNVRTSFQNFHATLVPPGPSRAPVQEAPDPPVRLPAAPGP